MKRELLLDQGDPIIEKSKDSKLYFYAWSDDTKKVGFRFNLKDRVPYAKCFYRTTMERIYIRKFT